jgi:hypothetical protein
MALPLGEASSGNAMLKLNRPQLEEAKAVLEAEGFAIKEERLAPLQQQGEGQTQGGSAAPVPKGVEQNGNGQAVPSEKKAVISTFASGEIMVFGEAAYTAAAALEVDVQISKKQTPYVKASNDKLPEVKAALQDAGFAVSTQPFSQPQQQAPKVPVPKAKADDGR